LLQRPPLVWQLARQRIPFGGLLQGHPTRTPSEYQSEPLVHRPAATDSPLKGGAYSKSPPLHGAPNPSFF
jgi:hypothetical protein